MLHFILDLLFPRRSLYGDEGAFITAQESQKIVVKPIVEMAESLQQHDIKYLDCIRAALPYDSSPLVRRAVHTLKYRRVPGLHITLAQLIVRSLQIEDFQGVLCPVPLHWTRQFWRGFNQAELLAHVVGEGTNLPVKQLLRRARPTGSQARRNRSERLIALDEAFRVKRSTMPKTVILIDDLATTGSTLDACAYTLKKAGVERVEGWVVAHG